MLATSDPAPGSLTPIHATKSPEILGARNVFFSSWEPNLASAGTAMSCVLEERGGGREGGRGRGREGGREGKGEGGREGEGEGEGGREGGREREREGGREGRRESLLIQRQYHCTTHQPVPQ